MSERERLDVDVAIVGGGPAGLAAAIHLVNEARRRGQEPPAIAVLEKAAEFGAHSLSGAVMDPRGMDALLPGWRADGAPVEGDVTEEAFLFLTRASSFRLPFVPPQMNHHGGVVISLQRLCAWLAEKAEALEINMFPGFAGAALLREDGRVTGVRTGERGLDKKGQPKGNHEQGYDVVAQVTLLADGVRGNLSQPLIRDARLDDGRNPMMYAAGAKEVWQLPEGRVRGGRVWHTLGYPLPRDTFGGAWLYEMSGGLVSLGIVLGLDSPNPRLNLQQSLQELKEHPFFRAYLDGGEVVSYGAKAIPEGGYWSIPRLSTDGALLLGDAAGFVNTMRLKGVHLAIESGMCAAAAVLDALAAGDVSASKLAEGYDRAVMDGPIGRELHRVRNFRQPYQKGLVNGMLHTGLQMVTGGRGIAERYASHPDHTLTRMLAAYGPPRRPAPATDGTYLLDRMSDVYLSSTRHEENQPPHLLVADPDLCRTRCREEYGNPCTSFCPAGVYEMADGEGGPRLHLNFSNCVHCKVCDIADPYGIIFWTTPEGGDGPRYRNT